MIFTSQKNSLPRRPQNQEIQLTSSELLMILLVKAVLFFTSNLLNKPLNSTIRPQS